MAKRTKRLSQVVTVERDTQARAIAARTTLYKRIQKSDLYSGGTKIWDKVDDSEERPDESHKVRAQAAEDLVALEEILVPWYNLTASRERTNCDARADILIDGDVLLEDVPVALLLFLEKDLVHTRTFIEKLPILDSAYEWTRDPVSGLCKSAVNRSNSTKKVQKPIVLYPHQFGDDGQSLPAQTAMAQEDVVVGYWVTTKHSGALTAPRKKQLLSRVNKLITAIKEAREEANRCTAVQLEIGSAVFGYLFDG